MTKKHFIELANTVRSLDPRNLGLRGVALGAALAQWTETRDKLADFCTAQNPAFNRARWLAYIAGESGSNGGKVKK